MKRLLIYGLGVMLVGTISFAKEYASVNGVNINDEDLNVIARAIPNFQGLQSISDEQKKQLIEQAIERVLLVEEAKKSGIENDPKYKELIVKLKNDLALELWMKKEFESIKIDVKELIKFYNENKSKFLKPPTVKARHILVESEDDAKAIIAELDKTKSNIQAKFEELAKSKSTGPSGVNGGDLGWFGKKQMVKPFSDAAFALAAKSYTKTPVKTQFGYHVIYVEDKKSEQNIAYEQVKPTINQNLKMQTFQKSMKDKAVALKKNAKIEYK